MNKTVIYYIITMACGFFLAQNANAQESETIVKAAQDHGLPVESIAAVVDDKVVTTFDVRQRMRLMLLSAGGQIPPEAMPQVQERAIRDLVEENLKLIEAKKFELEVDEKDINAEVALMAGQSNLTAPQLETELARSGISMDSLKTQIRASIAWPELVQGRFRSRVRVNDDEIEDTLSRMKADAGKEQFQVSEICIPVDDPSRADEFYQGGLQLIEQMRRGVPFSVVAQQFSACTSAAVGGDLGWVRAGELPEELDSAIRELPTGAVTNPIPSDGALMIMAVRQKREAVVAGESTYKLAYVGVETAKGKEVAKRAVSRLADAEACSGRALRTDLGESIGYTLLENMTLDAIDPDFRDIVATLDRADKSAVIEKDGAFHGVYVCDKDEGLGLPSREALESRIYGRQLSRIGQQYLRDIERGSLVEVRQKELLNIGG